MATELWIKENPISMIEGESIVFGVLYEGATSVSSSSVTIYKNGTDITSTAAPGSSSESGNVVTMPQITAGSSDGGDKYVLVISATVDGNTELRKCLINVLEASAES